MNLVSHPSTISIGILYHNASEMIEWLCNTFGYEKKLVVEGKQNTITHAHLTFGNGSIMISSAENQQKIELCKSPKEIGGIGTAEIIVYIKEVDEHYNKTKSSGADIIIDIEDKPYGGRSYCCKDPEGHIWVFSSYNAWQ
ncbi:MAG: VOC family protein [Daejeonella sp.]